MDKHQLVFSVLQFSMSHISVYKGARAVSYAGYVTTNVRDLLLPRTAFEQLLSNSWVPDRTN